MSFRLFGVEIRVSYPFVAMAAALIVYDKTGLLLPTAAAIIIHEAAHLCVMLVSGCPPEKIELFPGSVKIALAPCFDIKKEVLILSAGSAANFAAAAFCLPFYIAYNSRRVAVFAAVQAAVGFFNLIPARGLDGGDLLFAALSRVLSQGGCERAVKIASLLFAAIIFSAGCFLGISGALNPSFFILGLYIFILSFGRR